MIIIIGAGITGLSAAYTLRNEGKKVRVLEASTHVGGNITSQQHGAYFLECGPNTLLLNDQLYSLLKDIGIEGSVRTAAPEAKHRFILKNEQYQELPFGPASLLTSGLFSFGEKWRIWKERKIPVGTDLNETVDAFFRRRFGDVVADYVVAPFVSGVYAGDPKQLLMSLAFPKIVAHEQAHGSVIKGMITAAKNRDEHRGIFSLEGGLQSFPNKLAEIIGDDLQLGTSVKQVFPQDGSWRVETASGEIIEAEKVIAAVPSFVLGDLVEKWAPEKAKALRNVNYPSVAAVYTAYKKSQIRHDLNGFGALHNHIEPSETLGTIFNSTVFPDRCPEDEVLLTTFVGGSRNPAKAEYSEEDIAELARLDHARFLGAKGNPVFQHVVKWPRGIPQYDARLPKALEVADELDGLGLIAAANWRGGISVPDSVKNGLGIGGKM